MARDRLFTYKTSQIHRYDTKTANNYRVPSCRTNIKESTILFYRGSKSGIVFLYLLQTCEAFLSLRTKG